MSKSSEMKYIFKTDEERLILEVVVSGNWDSDMLSFKKKYNIPILEIERPSGRVEKHCEKVYGVLDSDFSPRSESWGWVVFAGGVKVVVNTGILYVSSLCKLMIEMGFKKFYAWHRLNREFRYHDLSELEDLKAKVKRLEGIEETFVFKAIRGTMKGSRRRIMTLPIDALSWDFDWPLEIEHPADFDKAFNLNHTVLYSKRIREMHMVKRSDVQTFKFAGEKYLFFHSEVAMQLFEVLAAGGVIDVSEFNVADYVILEDYEVLKKQERFIVLYEKWLKDNDLVEKQELHSYYKRAAIDKATLEIRYFGRDTMSEIQVSK